MRESAGDLGAAKRPSKDAHRERQEHGRKEKQDGERAPKRWDASASQQRGAHSVQRVGDGIKARDNLQPIRQDAGWEKHAARDAGNSQEKPLCGIAAFKKQKITRGKNSEPRECEQRNQEDRKNGEPVRATHTQKKKKRRAHKGFHLLLRQGRTPRIGS